MTPEAEKRKCIVCSGDLSGRQIKYCSNICKYNRTVANKLELLESGKKTCDNCNEEKSLREFYPYKNGFRKECKKCTVEQNRNRPSGYIAKRKHHVKSMYNLDWEIYEALEQFQAYVCAICGLPPGRRALSVDHDHATGLVRGLLCMSCNAHLIGRHNDPEVFFKAYSYLQQPPLVQLGFEVYTKPGPTKKRVERRTVKRDLRKRK